LFLFCLFLFSLFLFLLVCFCLFVCNYNCFTVRDTVLRAMTPCSLLYAFVQCTGRLLFFPDEVSVGLLRNTGPLFHDPEF
jgi:hypothetical protein